MSIWTFAKTISQIVILESEDCEQEGQSYFVSMYLTQYMYYGKG